jgi:hypothetical protein
MRYPTTSSPLHYPEDELSDFEKAEAVPDSVEAQFLPVNGPSEPAAI